MLAVSSFDVVVVARFVVPDKEEAVLTVTPQFVSVGVQEGLSVAPGTYMTALAKKGVASTNKLATVSVVSLDIDKN